jgi:outer membrane protein assembly factor BamB
MAPGAYARASLLIALLAIPASLGCLGLGKGSFPVLRGERDVERHASARVSLVWHRVVNRGGKAPYRPIESASAALDPVGGRIYVGSTAGILHAFDAVGRPLFEYHADESIESAPALDAQRRVLYLGTGDGVLHAIDADTGTQKWKVEVGFPIDDTPLLMGDAVYLSSTENAVVAVSRKDGASLFSYKRPRGEDFTIRGRAGLALVDDVLLAGFDDGAVVALDASDGSVRWLYDTSNDLPEAHGKRPSFGDVDTTPTVIGRVVYVANFSAGLYRLDLDSGTVIWRDPELKGITSLVAAEKTLLMTSPSSGLVAWDTTQDRVLWRRPRERGTLSEPVVAEGDVVFYGESPGSFLAVDFLTGRELARIEGSEGFAAKAATAWNLAAVLGNGGTLYALRLE